ncbi:MAG TPA: hypothetical protein VMC81_04305 [Rhodocyclaceae bacterium]|nr:hypothetical protein [Rhodocyclaceae bacterium]
MPRGLTLGLLPCLLLAAAADAMETHGAIVVAPEYVSVDRSSPYYVEPPTVEIPRRSSRNDIELRAQEGGFNAQGILRQQVAEGSRPEYHGVANQFYYDGQFTPGLGWTAGKKVLSWGVGFGFKPLDVIQREDRRSINAPPLVGVPLLAIERLTDTDALTVVWTHPGQGRDTTDSGDPSLALHWYRLAGSDDYHGVARVSRRRSLEAGLGATHVIGDEWSIYAAALYQRHGWQHANTLIGSGETLAASDPMVDTRRGGGAKAVAGTQWTGESGWSTLLEAWYDADAWRRADWQALDALTAQQRALAGLAPQTAIDGNVAWSSQAFLGTDLLRENVLLRIAYDDRDGFKPYADVLVTPSDHGRVLTLGAVWEGNRQRLSLGARQFGGAAGSAYAQAPIRRIFWAEWRLAIF